MARLSSFMAARCMLLNDGPAEHTTAAIVSAFHNNALVLIALRIALKEAGLQGKSEPDEMVRAMREQGYRAERHGKTQVTVWVKVSKGGETDLAGEVIKIVAIPGNFFALLGPAYGEIIRWYTLAPNLQ